MTRASGARMLIDATDLPQQDLHTDLCIIGSGPAALTIAQSLGVERDMVLLEAGAEEASEDSQALYRGRNVGLPYFDLDGCRSRQFGGSANCWGGFCRVFDAHDFETREKIPHSGWPVTWDEMLPYFESAHRLCHLGPLDYRYARWAEASGQAPSPFTGPRVTPEIRQRATFDVAAVKSALRASQTARVCVNAYATNIVTDAAARTVTRVEFADAGGTRRTIRAKTVVLAAGGIENARLLLASRSVQANGLGNDHDIVGRYFMEHIDIEAGVFRPSSPELFRRQLVWKPAGAVWVRNSLAIDEAIRRDEQLLRCFFHIGELTVDHTWGYRSAAHIIEQLKRRKPVRNLRYHLHNLYWDRVPLMAAAKWRLHLTRNIPTASGLDGLLPLRVTAEPSPSPDSRVLLGRTSDRFGMPTLELAWHINQLDYDHVRRSLELFSQDASALNLGNVHIAEPSRWGIRGTYHHMGTTRMSSDPRRGVVDANCRLHHVDNLYVAGSSVFPTAGSGTPTLMIVAMSLRLADHLARQLGRGAEEVRMATA